MQKKSNISDKTERLSLVEAEIESQITKIVRLKKKIPLYILIGIVLSFVYPFFSGRRQASLIERMAYHYAVILGFVGFSVILTISYLLQEDKAKRKLRELKLKKHMIERE